MPGEVLGKIVLGNVCLDEFEKVAEFFVPGGLPATYIIKQFFRFVIRQGLVFTAGCHIGVERKSFFEGVFEAEKDYYVLLEPCKVYAGFKDVYVDTA